jgi:two-component system chemotaxis response regulator CheY
MRVLIADDSSTMRKILRALLAELGIERPTEARDAREALGLLEREPVDLVLMDMHMPEMDGLACVEEIRRRPAVASLPVVMVSSDAEPGQTDRARRAGVNSYVAKPFRAEALRSAIRAAVPGWEPGPAVAAAGGVSAAPRSAP